VDDDTFQRLLSTVCDLCPDHVAALEAAVAARRAEIIHFAGPLEPPANAAPARPSGPLALIEARLEADRRCPHCQSTKVQKWGKANGLRRYMCRPCKVTFNALTGTPLAQLHKRELWLEHTEALNDGISLRKVSKRLKIGLETAFRWRHRFLKSPKAMKPKELCGIVEADETYFLRSDKGSRKLKRAARKRGGTAKKPGLSSEQVPVLIARDRDSKATTDAVLADRSAASILPVLKPVMHPRSVLVSDGASSYPAVACMLQIPHVPLVVSAGERVCGDYHIQNVNNYTGRLKGWMARFNGVATKYLGSYLGWHRMNDRHGDTQTANLTFFAALTCPPT
jgi:transposase-like protein